MESGSNLVERLQILIALKLERAAKAKAITNVIRESGAYRWVGFMQIKNNIKLDMTTPGRIA